jgi:hypothetical protein
MFPGESDNTLQQTLQSSINMEDAVDKLLNSGNISLKPVADTRGAVKILYQITQITLI